MKISHLRKVRPYLLLTSVCLIGFITSCNKINIKPDLPNEPTALQLKTYKNLTSIRAVEDRKLAYGALNSEERYAFWSHKLNLASESDQFTGLQKSKIKEIISALSVDFFNGGDAKEIFKNYFLKNWIASASNLFKEQQIFELLFTINPVGSVFSKNKLSGSISINTEAPKDCHCAVGAFWTCFSGHELPDGEWVPTHGECTKSGACVTDTSGCGALYDDDCDGNKCSNEPDRT